MSPIVTRDDLHRIFKNLDKNKNGLVSIHELHHLLEGMGIQTTSEELEKLFEGRTSLDCNDFLFFHEAITADQRVDDGMKDSDLLEAFKVFDLNGDGFITCEELQRTLSRMGLWDDQRQSGGVDCKHMIDKYDENSDGVLDFEEFKNMMMYVDDSCGEI